jgi:hypothetical protein
MLKYFRYSIFYTKGRSILSHRLVVLFKIIMLQFQHLSATVYFETHITFFVSVTLICIRRGYFLHNI